MLRRQAAHRGMGMGHGSEPYTEGMTAHAIERYTARVPSDAFLWAAVGSMLGSLAMQARGRHETANFIGQWAPTLLILGLYNKLVKIAGSDWTGRH